jgi:hypothetical protein
MYKYNKDDPGSTKLAAEWWLGYSGRKVAGIYYLDIAHAKWCARFDIPTRLLINIHIYILISYSGS